MKTMTFEETKFIRNTVFETVEFSREVEIEFFENDGISVEYDGKHDGTDLIEEGISIARFRGIQSGVRYAECFNVCDVALKVTTKRMLP